MFLEKPFSVAAVSAITPRPAITPQIDIYAIGLALWRRKLFILLCGLLGMVTVLAIAKAIPHRYTATAEILVDPRDLRVLDKEVTPRSVETDSGITVVESQVAVLSSNGVLKRAIQKLNLQSDPEFNGKKDNVAIRAIAWLSALVSTPKAVDTEKATLQALKQSLTVIRPERTFVIQLTVSSEDEDKSVRIGDAIVAAYLEDQAGFRSATNEGAAEAIDAGLDSMKKKVNEADQKIAAYKAEHGLGLASGRLVTEQQLTDTNNQLAVARADTSRIKAQLEDIKSSRGRADAIPEVAASPSLINLKKQLAVASADRARLAAQLLPRHPALIALQEQERQVRSDIDQEIKRVLTSVMHDYERAKQREDDLTKSVEQLQADMNGSSVAQIQLRELERDLDGTKTLYEQSVARSRETREQSRLNTSNVRVISSATAAPNRAFPPRNTVLAPAGFLLGMLLGACFVARKELFPAPMPKGSPDGPSTRLRAELGDFETRILIRDATEGSGAAKASQSHRSFMAYPKSLAAEGVKRHLRLRSTRLLQKRGRRVESKKISGARASQAVDALKLLDPGASNETSVKLENSALAAAASNIEGSPNFVSTTPIGVNDNANMSPAQVAPEAAKSAVPVFDFHKVSDLVQAASSYPMGMAIRRLADGLVASPHGAFALQVQKLRQTLTATRSENISEKPQIIVFASESSSAIKPVLLDAVAKSLADMGKKVLLLDLDEPRLASRGTEAVSGLPEQSVNPGDAFEIVSKSSSFDKLRLAKNSAFPITRDTLVKLGSYDVIVIGCDATPEKIALGPDIDIVHLRNAHSTAEANDGIAAALARNTPNLRGVVLIGSGASAAAVHAAS